MTPQQCKDARRLLGLTQQKLAKLIGVHQGHVSAFERTGRMSAPAYGTDDRVAAIRAIFEAAGVEFTKGDQPGVKLRQAN